MATLLTDKGEFSVPATDGLWMSAADAERATGWSLKPEGMCRDAVCVPLATSAVRGDRVDLAAFWQKLGAPAVHDGDVWALGASPEDRSRALAGLQAPDFELPDLAGTPHRLSALRGKKIFLATWASW
ncbi:MAG: redoxin domain-containing protein [Alphaproteobacteria bacterium]|nr:redoxin domain-containing protein [Alphaproteobacteria bacterium]